uniref:Uncharacterized protein n=1 Tax=Anguilla anguilla TaxID=7936 RepID=A0A0E9QCY8_ANGAN
MVINICGQILDKAESHWKALGKERLYRKGYNIWVMCFSCVTGKVEFL